jgi:hypothetical protein
MMGIHRNLIHPKFGNVIEEIGKLLQQKKETICAVPKSRGGRLSFGGTSRDRATRGEAKLARGGDQQPAVVLKFFSECGWMP